MWSQDLGRKLERAWFRGVRKLTFTGSLRAGREIGRIAAERILPLTLELGGKSPDIVFADADLAAAVPGVLKGFLLHAGQICLTGAQGLGAITYDGTMIDVATVRLLRNGILQRGDLYGMAAPDSDPTHSPMG
ncbi:aldehyde dehydrogenase family protein [Methylocapsa sp. S129]|uniref:aldehyde dehydrogenase family protein n=1 Tax=Methylocapsa sp. S129 TaxID=1641869 RepID=UPI00352A9DBF